MLRFLATGGKPRSGFHRKAGSCGRIPRVAAFWFVAAVSLLAGPAVWAQQRPAVSEYQVKAALLYNFTRFVEWPAVSGSGSAKGPIVIGIIGADPFGPVLEQILEGKTVRGRMLEAKRFSTANDLQLCDVLFVSVSGNTELQLVLGTLEGAPVLTVGETPEFTRLGGMIAFVMESKRVRFEINRRAAEHSRIKIRSQLLQLARKVSKGP